MAAMAPPPGEAPRQPLLEPPELYTGWISGTPTPDSAVGKYIPQPRVAGTNGKLHLLDDLIGNGFTLLGDNLDPATLLSAEQRSAWDGLGASYRAVLSPDQASKAESDIIDIEGSLLAWMRGFGAKAIALRPDRFVAASDVQGLNVPMPTGDLL